MWTFGGCSAIGASHQESGGVCQDYCAFGVGGPGDEVFWGIVADGAGSSRYSDLAARVACERITTSIQNALTQRTLAELIEKHEVAVANWLEGARVALKELEEAYPESTYQDFYNTIVGVVLGESGGFLFHVGDGAVIEEASDGTCLVRSWPHNGEYSNTTYFLNEGELCDTLRTATLSASVRGVCLITDGVQRIALDLVEQVAFQPFFSAFFTHLRTRPAGEAIEFMTQLAEFLSSERVNEHTSDDKTLVIAVRTAASETQRDPVMDNGAE